MKIRIIENAKLYYYFDANWEKTVLRRKFTNNFKIHIFEMGIP